MPAKSERQRRLMAMALAYKRHEIKLKDLPAGVRDRVRKIARSMSVSDLEDFARKPKKRRKRR